MSPKSETLRSAAQSLLRGGAGHRVVAQSRQPALPLTLYEFEGCPFCRRVREALSAFDLDALIVPCPRGGRHRAEVVRLGQKAQFPFLIDPNTQTQMYESQDIIDYLSRTYADAAEVWQHQSAIVQGPGAQLTQRLQQGHGREAAPDGPEARAHLHLWSFEASPYCRLVRETLCELQLPYMLHNVARGGARRDAHREAHGKVMVPYLEDPNTSTKMYESHDIVAYLRRTYAKPS